MERNKIIYGGETLIDLTDATAKASDIASGKTAYGADGTKLVGTNTNTEWTSGVHMGKHRYLRVSPDAGAGGVLFDGEYVIFSANAGDSAGEGESAVLGTKTITQNGTYSAEDDELDGYSEVVVNVPSEGSTPTLQTKTATPTTSRQTITPDTGYDGLSSVTVNAMPSGTAGTPTVTKGTVSRNAIPVTPSVTNTAGYISGGTKTGTALFITASELVSGSETKTQNGTYDVTNLAEIVVDVPATTPSLQSKTATPTESQQTISPDSGYDGLSSVTVGAISSTYVGSGVQELELPEASTFKGMGSNIATVNRSTSTQYINIGSGYNDTPGYYTIASTPNGTVVPPSSITASNATVSTGNGTLTLTKAVPVTPYVSTPGYISAGTAGDPTVTLTANVTTKAAATITPSTSQQTIAAGTYLTGVQTIAAIPSQYIIPSGNKEITENGTGIDVSEYATVSVSVSGGEVNIDTKTATASNYPTSLQFTGMRGQPKMFALKSTSQISSSGSTSYYYIIDMIYNGTTTVGNCFRIGSTRRVENITSGYSWSYSGTTLTLTTSASSRSSSPGAFNNGYQLIYVY